MSYGEIYKATNKINGKIYIGQAAKYQGKFNNEWGYIKRWQSHVREALKSKQDHCSYLNNAIRKYGEKSFTVVKIAEADNQEDLDNLEIDFIQTFNTLAPNGYNLDTGGKKGYTVSDITKQKQSIVRLGMRKNKAERKYEEDKDLPKYICGIRRKEKLVGYRILNFPVGVDKPEYITKHIIINSKRTKEEALQQIIVELESLKEKYKFICKNTVENENQIPPPPPKKTERKKNQLPPFIFPIHSNDTQRLLIGYYVEGPDYPRCDFIGKTNRWNLNDAIKYILRLDIKKSDDNFVIPNPPDDLPKTRLRKNSIENNLPKYVIIVKDKNGIKGFNIKIGKILDENKKRYCKSFVHPNKTLEQKYYECIEELRYQLKTHNITN